MPHADLEVRRAYTRDLYARTKTECLARNEERRQENLRRAYAYLAENPCVDCGESDPVVLTFDHVRGVKKAAVSALMSWGWETVAAEIAKCDVRCANCHKRKTARQLGYRDYREVACL